jgi:hypothetical protein
MNEQVGYHKAGYSLAAGDHHQFVNLLIVSTSWLGEWGHEHDDGMEIYEESLSCSARACFRLIGRVVTTDTGSRE